VSGVIWLRMLRWLLLVLHWDGVLPLLVWSLPSVLQELFPGRRGVVEFSAVVFPIVVFGWRYRVGLRVIAGNACGGAVRRLQRRVFFVGIFVRVLVDAVVMLSCLIPAAAAGGVWREMLIPLGIYVAAMLVAMYPGGIRRVA